MKTYHKYRNLPNILTTIRIAVIPIIISMFYFDDKKLAHQLSSACFLLACITDFFDGYIARKFHIETNFGRMLDPVADKILVGSILIMLVKFDKVDELPCILILTREFLIAGLREFLAQLRVSVPVSGLSKIKTFMQMAALFILLLGSKGSGIEILSEIGNLTLWVAAILTLITGWSYLRASMKYFWDLT
jgi:cardiolipin synthase